MEIKLIVKEDGSGSMDGFPFEHMHIDAARKLSQNPAVKRSGWSGEFFLSEEDAERFTVSSSRLNYD